MHFLINEVVSIQNLYSLLLPNILPVNEKDEIKKNIACQLLNVLCKHIININKLEFKNIEFSKVTTKNEWESIVNLRLKVYHKKNRYLLDEMKSGVDNYDSRSYIYAAWINAQPVATIRLTPYPFETLKFISEPNLANFLGENYHADYLEWTRLLVDYSVKIDHLMPVLVTYAGIRTLIETEYRNYFGYTKPIMRKLLSKFYISNRTIEFTIPSRQGNNYQLLKGNFAKDFQFLLEKQFLF